LNCGLELGIMAFVSGIAAFQGGWAGRRPAAGVPRLRAPDLTLVLPVLPDDPLLRVVIHAPIDAVQAGPVAAQAGRIAKVRVLDELVLD
jgi:hypothetical protein